MPYKLRGTCVVRSDTGALVKRHATTEQAHKHLAALKVNVEEGVLGSLLEGFAPDPGPQVLDGRLRSGDRVSVPVKGSERIVARVVRPSDSKPASHVIVAPEGGGPHVEAAISSARHDTPEQHGREREKRRAEFEAQAPPMAPAKGQQPAKPEPGKAAKPGPVRESLLGELLEGFDDARHPRDFRGRFIHVGSKVRLMSGGQEGVLTHTVESIDGSSVTVRAPGKPSLGGGKTSVVPASSLVVHGPSTAPDVPAAPDRHGGFKVGDQIRHRTPSVVNGKVEGYSPYQSAKVVRLARNGYLTVEDPKFGTTHDVHPDNVKHDTLHPGFRGEQAQRSIAQDRARLAQEKAARAVRPAGQGAPGHEHRELARRAQVGAPGHDPRGPVNPAHVDPSRHPTPPAGLPPDAAGLMRARARVEASRIPGLGPEGQAARARGASALTTEHADTRDKLANLPVGQRYTLHGPQGAVGHVERTSAGYKLSGSEQVHKSPSSAAGHAMRMQRKAASSPEQARVMAGNYAASREVAGMNARQGEMARREAERAAAMPVAKAALAKGQRPAGGSKIMAAAAKAQAERADILAKSPNAQRELEAYRSAGPGTPEVTASTPNVKAYISGKIEAGSLSNQERAFTLQALKHDAPHVQRMARNGTVAQAAYDRILRQIKELERLSSVRESAPAGMLGALFEARS